MGTSAGEGKKQENKKEEILKVSRGFFIEQGYEKTSMRQIAAAADVSLGLVAYHLRQNVILRWRSYSGCITDLPLLRRCM